jgi:ABC-type antimicrobial peptide transport system permease subunit
MLKNYFSVAVRNLLRNKVFSVINILGLSIGISSALVIYLIAQYDFSFDRFEPAGDRIYRVVSKSSFQGNVSYDRGVPAPLGEAVRKELSGIEEISSFRYFGVEKTTVPAGPNDKRSSFKTQTNVIFADEGYFRLVPYEWLAGSSHGALAEPGRVVLDESRAKLYFPRVAYKDIIGQKVIYDDTIVTTVAGIVADLDAKGNTDFSYKEFISLPTLLDNKYLRDQNGWDDWGSSTSDHEVYARLGKGVQPSTVEAGLSKLLDKYKGAEVKKSGHNDTWLLQPLEDIHFNADYGTLNADYGNTPTASKPVLYGLVLVSTFLLLLGCINFINLTTAQSVKRAKEIGIRKTMGSSRGQLIGQFLCETFIITLAATVLSMVIAPLLLKAFSEYIPQGLHFFASLPYLFAFGAVLVCIVSFLAGFYPALVLSSMQPVEVLKKHVHHGSGKLRLRQTLTVFQFVIAQAFLMATLLVGKQISYLINQDLGFRKEAILSFKAPYSSDTSYIRRLDLVHQLQQIPGIVRVSLGNDMPSSQNSWGTPIDYNDGKNSVRAQIEVKRGDTNYLSIFHIPLLAGRAVAPSDTIKELLINETCLLALGFKRPQDVLGKVVAFNNRHVPIVGVMKDFYAHPLDDANAKIVPMVFTEANETCRQIVVALPGLTAKSAWKTTIERIESLYKKAYPDEDFNFNFFDDSINAFYASEQRTARLLQWAMGISVFISCIGLLGLVSYTTRQRVKEIGVRKVLGASVTGIVTILSKEFIKLVAIAFVLATPLVWWGFHRWIENFSIRTEMSWWVFAASGMGMILLAFFTLSIQTIRAARANPINSLRTE